MPELVIRFLSDWRIGTGTGIPGTLSDAVRRENGLPVLPACSITGIWRDGCERVGAALDGNNPDAPWTSWVRVLFGSQPGVDRRHSYPPQPAALAVRTATLPAPLAAALRANPRLARCLHTVRPGVAINPDTGQAAPDCLRALEVTRGELCLYAPLELNDTGWTPQQRATAWILLHLGAREVRALGGGRRRGLGRCTLTVPDPTEMVAEALRGPQPPLPAPVPVPARPSIAIAQPTLSVSRRAQGSDWLVIDLRAVCVDPVLCASVVTDNTVRGRSTVPGAQVLPAVVARARKIGVEIEHLVRSGELRCEPLVVEIGGVPGRPLPRTFVAPKGASVLRLRNQLRTTTDGASRSPRDYWVGVPNNGVLPVRSGDLQVRLHNTVEDALQRPTEEVGGLFAYEAIPAGRVLRGRVRLRMSSRDGERLVEALTGCWRLGRSKKDEYGRVDVTASLLTPPIGPSSPPSRQVTLWFVTDAVLLDSMLVPVTTLDGVLTALGAALGTPVELAAPVTGGTSPASVQFGRHEGWQSHWVRPRPSLFTVAAGSVLVLRRTDGEPFSPPALTALGRDGIGVRRAEGFGVVAVNDPLLDLSEIDVAVITEDAHAGPDAGPLDQAGEKLLDQLAEEALRREVEERAATLPRNTLGALTGLPPAQLGWLCTALSAAACSPHPGPATERVIAFLRSGAARSERWPDQGERQLKAMLTEGAVWDLLKVPVEHRRAGVEPWARARVLAHLLAAGASAAHGGHEDGT